MSKPAQGSTPTPPIPGLSDLAEAQVNFIGDAARAASRVFSSLDNAQRAQLSH